jgi:hypothetical protein
MENNQVENVLTDFVLDEDGNKYDRVLMDRNLARTKGLLIGATVVGAGWLGTYLYKKFRNRKGEVIEVKAEEDIK